MAVMIAFHAPPVPSASRVTVLPMTMGPAYGTRLEKPLRMPSARANGVWVMARNVVVSTALVVQMNSSPRM